MLRTIGHLVVDFPLCRSTQHPRHLGNAKGGHR
jgi:hypothetical protein